MSIIGYGFDLATYAHVHVHTSGCRDKYGLHVKVSTTCQ